MPEEKNNFVVVGYKKYKPSVYHYKEMGKSVCLEENRENAVSGKIVNTDKCYVKK